MLNETHTYDHLSRRLWRQPEDDQSQEGEEDAGKDDGVTVEGPHPLQLNGKCQVYVWFLAAGVPLDIPAKNKKIN